MNPVKRLCTFCINLLCALCLEGVAAERAVTLGANPVFSPDGSSIAFQRLEGDVFKVGVALLSERGHLARVDESSITWIENGPGNAAYPAWTPDGSLVYMAGNDSETAYGAWKGGSQSGYGLRLWRDGEKIDLTNGRCRDYTPCVSPDGKQVFFVTTRGVESESASYSQAAASQIAVIDLPQSSQVLLSHRDTETQRERHVEEPLIVLDAPNGNNSGYVQPAVSPDGSLLIWGHLESFFDTWRIYGMRLATGKPLASPGPRPVGGAPQAAPCRITPTSLTALSPRFHSNGRLICFTGFRIGDPGWGVWVEDIHTGKVRRLCDGENPCFSPDGGSIAYDRDGTIYLRPFDAADAPDTKLPDISDDAKPEHVLFSEHGIAARETRIDISGDSRFAFGDDTTFFIRATVRLAPGVSQVRQILVSSYSEHPRAIQLYLAGGEINFASRDHTGKYFAARAPLAPLLDSAPYTILAVRTPTRLLLAVDGTAPQQVFTGGALPLDTPQSLTIGADLTDGDAIDTIEIGTGWPTELPTAPTKEALLH